MRDPNEEKLRKWHEEFDPKPIEVDPDEVFGWSYIAQFALFLAFLLCLLVEPIGSVIVRLIIMAACAYGMYRLEVRHGRSQ